MLARLSIRDIVLIESLDLDFGEGLSVLTGETGAGKSILLDAFALALGGRGDASLVRQGAEQGQVIAAFELPPDHACEGMLAELGLEADGFLILRRIQHADGRTRAFVNDQPASVTTLRTLGARLVEIHGQHDDRALVDAETHRALLDAYAGLDAAAAQVAQLWRAWRKAQEEAAAHRARMEQAERERDWLTHASAELSRLAAEPGEEARLAERRIAMMAGEKVAEDLRSALDAVAGSDGPTASLSTALRRLARRATGAQSLVDAPTRALDAALTSLDEARQAIEAALRDADHDPAELERIEERLFALRAASRKYNVPADDLAMLAARYEADLQTVEAGVEQAAALARQVAASGESYFTAARALSAKRRASGAKLDTAVGRELKPLKLERATFTTEIRSEESAAGAYGIDAVEFWVQTNPGTRPGPLMKIASGGELARFLLALKVVLADRGSAPTLVFDEIDTGVGGAVADAIGARLASLGSRVQVLAVTHAPQVAARAGRHYLITKQERERGRRVTTMVAELAEERRREEIARMLAGAEITEEARAAAERLIRAAS